MKPNIFTRALGVAAMTAGVFTPTANANAQYAYVADYNGGQILRYDATTGAPVSPNPYIPGIGGVEGMGGRDNILAAATLGGPIHFIDVSAPTPTLIHTLFTPINPLRINFSLDGSKFYVAGNNEVLVYDYKAVINSPTNTAIAPLNSIIDVGHSDWGVAVNPLTNEVYHTTGWFGGPAGVIKTDPLLNSPVTVVAAGANGITGLAGITFAKNGQSFYVVNGGLTNQTSNDFIQHYKSDGTFIDTLDLTGLPAHALDLALDAEIGPDGNLYVTSFTSGTNPASGSVLEFNTTTDSYMGYFVAPGSGGLLSAKTIHFTSNNINTAVPEPGSLALFLGMGVTGCCFLARRKVRARQAI